MKRLLLICCALGAALLPAAAVADPPTRSEIPIDFSFTPPQLSNACGFTVTRHVEGKLTVHTFVDRNGLFSRELYRYHLVETVSANGKTLTGRTIQNIAVKLRDDGSFTVAFTGTDFRLPVPGAGTVFGTVGRLVLLFAADNTLLEVIQDVGDVERDTAVICEALSHSQ